jgi:outer membrane protein assembly factor BamA
LQDSLRQKEITVRVDSIVIYGNKVTEADVILQELTFKKGDFVSEKILSYNRERVYSLGLFTNVNIFPIFRDSLAFVVINVKESWYVWPIPVLDIKDNMIKRTTYGLYLQFKNFRGKNETLTASASFGYDPSFGISYYRPWLLREDNIFLSVNLFYRSPVNKSMIAERLYGESFSQRIYTGDLTIGKRFDLFNVAGIWAGYDYIETPRFIPGISASDQRIDRLPRAGISYTFDSRNLKQFPDSGLYVAATYEHKGFGLNNINYAAAKLDLRSYYRLLGDLTGKWRLASRATMGPNIPYYDYSILGSLEKVRGHYNEIREGHFFYLASAELKYPIIKEWNFSIKLPLLPQQLTSYRIAVFTNIFGDTGAVQDRNTKLGLRDFYSGYGAGLTLLLLPYNVIRFEYALNELRQGELLFGFGFSF